MNRGSCYFESGEKPVRFLCALLAVLCLCLVFTLCDFLVDTRVRLGISRQVSAGCWFNADKIILPAEVRGIDRAATRDPCTRINSASRCQNCWQQVGFLKLAVYFVYNHSTQVARGFGLSPDP